MRSRLQILNVNGDGSNGSTVATVWASLMSLNTSGPADGESAQAIRPLSRYQAVLRFRSDITTKMRAIYEGVTYEIHSTQDPDGYRRWLQVDMQATP